MGDKYKTDEIINAIEATNGMVYLAAKKLGCTPQTIYNRARKTNSIRQAIDNARAIMLDFAEQKLRQSIINGDPWAVQFILKTLGKNRGYVERQELQHNIKEMDDQELIEFLRKQIGEGRLEVFIKNATGKLMQDQDDQDGMISYDGKKIRIIVHKSPEMDDQDNG